MIQGYNSLYFGSVFNNQVLTLTAFDYSRDNYLLNTEKFTYCSKILSKVQLTLTSLLPLSGNESITSL